MTNRILSRVVVAVLVALILMGLRAVTAQAATYEAPCPTAGSPAVQTDPVCERLTLLVAAAETAALADVDLLAALQAVETNTAATGAPVSGAVALAGDSQLALEDLRMVAAWTLGLLVAGLLLMPILLRTFARNA